MLPFEFVHNSVWKLHSSAATPPSFLFFVVSTTNLVGHNIFTSFVDRHKNITFHRTSMATEQVAVQSSQCENNKNKKY